MARLVLGGRHTPRLVLDGRRELCPGMQAAPPAPPAGGDLLAGQSVTVRRRLRTGYDEDGNPEFSWTDVVSGAVLGSESRRETDPVAGTSRWTATVTVLYDGPDWQDATAEVIDGRGLHWAVTAVLQLPGRLQLALARTETPPTEEDAG